MNVRSTVVLAVIVAVLGTLYLFREKVKAPDDDTGHPQMFTFKADDVASVEMTVNGKLMRADKKGSVWLLTQPITGLAASTDMQSFVSQLAEMSAERVVSEDVTNAALKQYGLDKPTFAVKLYLKSTKETPTATFGSRSPGGTGWYARVGDQGRVLLAPNTVTASLNKTTEQWREKAPLPIETAKVDRLVSNTGGVEIEVDKVKDKDEWAIEKPRKAKADAQSVTSFLSKLQGIRVTTFYDKMKPSDPQLKPTSTLKIWNKDERDPVTLTVGATTTGGVYAARSAAGQVEVFLLPATALASLKVDTSELADKHMFDFEVEKVTKADMFQIDAGEAAAEKKGDTWEFAKPAPRKDDMGKVTSLLYSLKGLKYERQVTDASELGKARAGLKKPFARFNVTGDKGRIIATLVVGGEAPQSRRYVTGLSADVYVTDAAFANDWKANIVAVKNASPSPAAAASASRGGASASTKP